MPDDEDLSVLVNRYIRPLEPSPPPAATSGCDLGLPGSVGGVARLGQGLLPTSVARMLKGLLLARGWW